MKEVEAVAESNLHKNIFRLNSTLWEVVGKVLQLN